MLSGLTQYVPEATLTVYDNLEFLIRLLLSAALGALVGLERSKRRKEAGIRTHCIIACTSALFMIVSKYAFLDCATLDGLRGADPARIAAQVVSGQASIPLELGDLESGIYLVNITSFLAEKKADQPLTISGCWQASLEI